MIAAAGHPTYWDPVTDTPWTAYQVGTQWHRTYFDDPTSLALKAQLANFFHMAGVGIWALGMDGNNPANLAALLGNAPVVEGRAHRTAAGHRVPTLATYDATPNIALTPIAPRLRAARSRSSAPWTASARRIRPWPACRPARRSRCCRLGAARGPASSRRPRRPTARGAVDLPRPRRRLRPTTTTTTPARVDHHPRPRRPRRRPRRPPRRRPRRPPPRPPRSTSTSTDPRPRRLRPAGAPGRTELEAGAPSGSRPHAGG